MSFFEKKGTPAPPSKKLTINYNILYITFDFVLQEITYQLYDFIQKARVTHSLRRQRLRIDFRGRTRVFGASEAIAVAIR